MKSATRAVYFTKYGGPLLVGDLPLRELKPNQILVKTHSVSLNPIDDKRHDGSTKLILKDTFPAGICFDVSGVVEQAGADVKNLAVGDRVCARSKHSGTLAEYCVVDSEVVAKIPENVSYNDAAALPLAGLTAYQCLLHAGLKEGESVFISGGAGGVGSFAVQIAKKVFKAGRVVTTSSAGKIDFCKSLGADEVLDYKAADPYTAAKGPFDVVFDTVGDAAKMGGSLIKPGKLLVSIASTPEPSAFDRAHVQVSGFLKAALSVASLWTKWKASPGTYNYVWMQPNGEHLQKLIDLVGDGSIKCQIDSTFEGLEKAPEALARLKTGHAKGKILVIVKS